MLLLLNRHANAGQRDPSQWADDSLRPLTDKGRKVQRDVSRYLRKRGFSPTLVVTSPWLRAQQTAQILVDAARVPTPPLVSEALIGTPDFSRLTDDIGDQPPEALVALVGHSPWMEELASILLGGSTADLRIDFPKSGVIGIDVEGLVPGEGELRFMLRPKMV